MKLFNKIRTKIAYQKHLHMLQAIRCGELRMKDLPFEKRVQSVYGLDDQPVCVGGESEGRMHIVHTPC